MKYFLLFYLIFLYNSAYAQNANEINPFAKLKYDSVVAYNYNVEEPYNHKSGKLIVNKKINKKVGIIFTRRLKREETKQIINILTDTTSYGNSSAACFEPRFAIIFFNKTKIVAVLEICLECNLLSSTLKIYAQERQQYVYIFHENQLNFDEIPYYDTPKNIREDKNTTIRPYKGFTKIGRKRISDFCKQIKMKYISPPSWNEDEENNESDK
jgi:hypothetical protein